MTTSRPSAERLAALRAVRFEPRFPALDPRDAHELLLATLGCLYPHFDRARTPARVPARVPTRRGDGDLEARLAHATAVLERLLAAIRSADGDREAATGEGGRPDPTVERYLDALPGIGRCLRADASCLCDEDPAATSVDEVVLAYPGFFAIAAYRVAHLLHGLDVPIVPRLIAEFAHRETGCDIHPGARIDCPVAIDHGTGLVIGESAVVGRGVKLYQGVTLGALSVDKRLAGTKRHPTVEEDVVIYAGATILGGETVIGRGSIIGGNVWLTASVPPHSVVTHVPHAQSTRRREKAAGAETDSA